jgi:hypothetical protein
MTHSLNPTFYEVVKFQTRLPDGGQVNVKYQMTKLSKSLDYDESCRHRIQYVLSFCHLDFTCPPSASPSGEAGGFGI